MTNYQHYNNILSFWRDIEYLTFLDAPNKEDKKNNKIILEDNLYNLPWDNLYNENIKKYVLYLGVTSKIKVLEHIKEMLKDDTKRFLDNFSEEYIFFLG